MAARDPGVEPGLSTSIATSRIRFTSPCTGDGVLAADPVPPPPSPSGEGVAIWVAVLWTLLLVVVGWWGWEVEHATG